MAEIPRVGALNCPNQVTWTNDIQSMFTQLDIDSMKTMGNPPIDLSSYDQVKTNAHPILGKVASGAMPCPQSGEPQWSQDQVNTFACWIQQGCPM